MPLCEYTGNALWTLGVGVGRANRGSLSLQFRVAGLSWPFELLGRSVRNGWASSFNGNGRESESGSVA